MSAGELGAFDDDGEDDEWGDDGDSGFDMDGGGGDAAGGEPSANAAAVDRGELCLPPSSDLAASSSGKNIVS